MQRAVLAIGLRVAQAALMRTLGLVFAVVVAACTSVETTDFTCGTSLDDYCAGSGSCTRSLAAVEQDPAWCRATVTPCGDYDLVMAGVPGDAWSLSYFKDDQLVAIRAGGNVQGGGGGCVAGPETFAAPHCTSPGRPASSCPGGAR
jgi:hypothetical protein